MGHLYPYQHDQKFDQIVQNLSYAELEKQNDEEAKHLAEVCMYFSACHEWGFLVKKNKDKEGTSLDLTKPFITLVHSETAGS